MIDVVEEKITTRNGAGLRVEIVGDGSPVLLIPGLGYGPGVGRSARNGLTSIASSG